MALRTAFEVFASDVFPGVAPSHVESTHIPSPTMLKQSSKLLPISQVLQVIRQVPGYQEMLASDLDKDLKYVIEEAGFKGRKEVGFEEFVEVRHCPSNPFLILMTVIPCSDLWRSQGNQFRTCSGCARSW